MDTDMLSFKSIDDILSFWNDEEQSNIIMAIAQDQNGTVEIGWYITHQYSINEYYGKNATSFEFINARHTISKPRSFATIMDAFSSSSFGFRVNISSNARVTESDRLLPASSFAR